MRIHLVRGTEAALELSLFLLVWGLSLTLLGLLVALATAWVDVAILLVFFIIIGVKYAEARRSQGQWTSVVFICFLGSLNSLLVAMLMATNNSKPQPKAVWLAGFALVLLVLAVIIEWRTRSR